MSNGVEWGGVKVSQLFENWAWSNTNSFKKSHHTLCECFFCLFRLGFIFDISDESKLLFHFRCVRLFLQHRTFAPCSKQESKLFSISPTFIGSVTFYTLNNPKKNKLTRLTEHKSCIFRLLVYPTTRHQKLRSKNNKSNRVRKIQTAHKNYSIRAAVASKEQ